MTTELNNTVGKTVTHILGYPRVGAQRELKFAQEKYWRGEIEQKELLAVGCELRQRHWKDQTTSGLDFVTAGDFACINDDSFIRPRTCSSQ